MPLWCRGQASSPFANEDNLTVFFTIFSLINGKKEERLRPGFESRWGHSCVNYSNSCTGVAIKKKMTKKRE